jgi:hypothetical protein
VIGIRACDAVALAWLFLLNTLLEWIKKKANRSPSLTRRVVRS